jgi:protein TonB
MTFLPTFTPATANDRFKSRSGDWLSVGLIFAVLAHGSLFLFFPELRAAEVEAPATIPLVIEQPPAVALPAPAHAIERPAAPRVTAVLMDERRNPYHLLPPAWRTPLPEEKRLPAPRPGVSPETEPSFVPRDEEPVLRNRVDLLRELKQRYPPALREAGIEGTAVLYVYVSETGSVTNTRVKRSSGFPGMDEVAVDVLRHAEFTPASLRDEPVGVWIELPVKFATR